MWSVAVEWQIYFLMPLLLLPLWRRFHPSFIVGGLTLITLIPAFIGTGSFIHPWFVALFAAGMWSGQLTLRPEKVRASGWLSAILALLVPVSAAVGAVVGFTSIGITEVLAGFAVAACVVWAGRRSISGALPAAASVLQSRPLLRLGLFSYSLYLLHSPLLALGNLLLLPLRLPILAQYTVMTFVVAPLAIAICYGFFLLVERRFLNTRQRHAAKGLAKETTQG
jgi:peptidoglycan/LPS O-acetylase OafA/YrhL